VHNQATSAPPLLHKAFLFSTPLASYCAKHQYWKLAQDCTSHKRCAVASHMFFRPWDHYGHFGNIKVQLYPNLIHHYSTTCRCTSWLVDHIKTGVHTWQMPILQNTFDPKRRILYFLVCQASPHLPKMRL